jgi:hypothetical protein
VFKIFLNESVSIGTTDSHVVIRHSRLKLRVFQRSLSRTIQGNIRTESECDRIPTLDRMIRADIPFREERVQHRAVKLMLLCQSQLMLKLTYAAQYSSTADGTLRRNSAILS